MEAIRKILADAQVSVTVELPPSFRHRPIEVVVMPLDAEPASGNAGAAATWPADFFRASRRRLERRAAHACTAGRGRSASAG